tara:strand:+ start:1858 stop:2979 length:1122 start_codon:yes stop_codon:yes gene_type:complete
MAKLKLSNISKNYGKLTILNNINLDIIDGEFLVLVGPSGCGKSTTLRLIAGLESPNIGDIYIEDEKINDKDPSKRDIAMVFQNYALYPHMTVFDNMAFGLKLQKLDGSEINKRVEEASEILMIEKYLNRKPKELSGGQRQRVALGRAIVRKPKVFLFDEPLSNLDAKLRSDMRVEIKKLHNILGATMIYVTHDQTEAMTMGDRIAVMNDGIIEQLDTPRKLYDQPKNKFVASFIGSPEMNFINGKIKKEEEFEFKNDDLSLMIPNEHPQKQSLSSDIDVVLGVRSEDLHNNLDQFKGLSNKMSIKDSFLEKIQCKVILMENLGSSIVVHCKIGDSIIRMNAFKTFQLKTDEELSIRINMMKVYFFERDTGEII